MQIRIAEGFKHNGKALIIGLTGMVQLSTGKEQQSGHVCHQALNHQVLVTSKVEDAFAVQSDANWKHLTESFDKHEKG